MLANSEAGGGGLCALPRAHSGLASWLRQQLVVSNRVARALRCPGSSASSQVCRAALRRRGVCKDAAGEKMSNKSLQFYSADNCSCRPFRINKCFDAHASGSLQVAEPASLAELTDSEMMFIALLVLYLAQVAGQMGFFRKGRDRKN